MKRNSSVSFVTKLFVSKDMYRDMKNFIVKNPMHVIFVTKDLKSKFFYKHIERFIQVGLFF